MSRKTQIAIDDSSKQSLYEGSDIHPRLHPESDFA